jgi:hypothetical protein
MCPNLASYVRSGQAVLSVGDIVAGESQLLPEIFGYVNTSRSSTEATTVRLSDNVHSITKGFEPREFKVACKGGVWRRNVNTANVLAIHCDLNGEFVAPALIMNKFGRGKTVQLCFEPKEYSKEIGQFLRNSIDWLLKD